MDFPAGRAPEQRLDFKQEMLKKDIMHVLSKRGEAGVKKKDIWNIVQKETGRRTVAAKDFGVIRLKDLLELKWKDEIETFSPDPSSTMQYYRLRQTSAGAEAGGHDSSKTNGIQDSTPSVGVVSPVEGAQGQGLVDLTEGSDDGEITDTPKSSFMNISLQQIQHLEEGIVQHYSNLPKNELKLRKFTKLLRDLMKGFADIHGVREGKALAFIKKNLQHLVHVDTDHKHLENFVVQLKKGKSAASSTEKKQEAAASLVSDLVSHDPAVRDLAIKADSGDSVVRPKQVDSKPQQTETLPQQIDPTESLEVEKKQTSAPKPSAMQLMSSMAAWGKPAVPQEGKGKGKKRKEKKSDFAKNIISLVDDGEEINSDHDSDVEIVEDSSNPVPGPSDMGAGASAPMKQMPFSQFQARFLQMTTPGIPQASLLGTPPLMPKPGQFGLITNQPILVPNLVASPQAPFLMPAVPRKPEQLEPELIDDDDDRSSTSSHRRSTGWDQHIVPAPSRSGYDMASFFNEHAHARNEAIDMVIRPVDRTEFEVKQVNVRPVFIPRGLAVTREYVDNIAKECIETLAEANETVTQDRVEKLLCQRFQCNNLRQLGVNYIDQLSSVHELNRLLSKVNVYILAFVKAQAICTLHELKEALKEYDPNKKDFTELKLGPLQRMQVVYQQFKFPPDQANIPEITSMDILDHFHNYLTKNKLWTARLELEPFMNYLIELYEADNAYMLGVRIRSLPLMAGVRPLFIAENSTNFASN